MNISHKISKMMNTLSTVQSTKTIIDQKFNTPVGYSASIQGSLLDMPSSTIFDGVSATNQINHGEFCIGSSKWGGSQRIGP